jgi:aldose 1-epimerase
MSVTPPSGEQFEIAFGDQTAVVTGVGGGLRTYSVGVRNVLYGYGVDEMATGGRGQVLIPWPNRLQDGKYEFGGRDRQLALTEPEHSNAIHGLVRWVSWTAREREPHRVVLEHVLHPQPGFPFMLELQIEYRLAADGLTVRTSATNTGAETCPFGCGAHPYLTVGTETIDDAVLRIPARTALSSDERGIPVGSLPVEGTALDFRERRTIGSTKLDHCFTDLERDGSRLVHAELHDGGRWDVTLWADESYPYVMVFTGDIPQIGRKGLAVEPMSCPPDAFRSKDGVVVLEPDASWMGTWGIEPR